MQLHVLAARESSLVLMGGIVVRVEFFPCVETWIVLRLGILGVGIFRQEVQFLVREDNELRQCLGDGNPLLTTFFPLLR